MVGAHHKILMSYQVLARKYRPQQFADVIAQRHITKTLTNALSGNRVSSGYLFTGPRGTGKTSTARILAKALNCAEGPTPNPCDKCQSCKEIIVGSSLDVLEIDAASNTGVDDIRALRENVNYLPAVGRKRIYIIDEIHRLSGSAFDALLKTLEEPPSHVVFIFATTEPHKVPETIRSRTQRYDFHRVSAVDLGDHLKKIAESEKLSIDDETLYLIARKADGSVRDSLSLLDQLSAFAGETINASQAAEALGIIERQVYLDYIEAVAAHDSAAGLHKVRELVESGAELSEFCSGLTDQMRNLLILKNTENPSEILELSESELESLKKQQDYFSTGDLLRMTDTVNKMIIDMKSGLSQRLVLETATIKLTSMESTIRFEEVLAHLAEPGDSTGFRGIMSQDDSPGQKDIFNSASKAPASADMTAVHEDNQPIPDAKTINLPIIQTGWEKFSNFLKRQNPMLSALLAMAEITEVKDNVITAVFHNAGGTSKQVLEKPDYIAIINTALREYFKSPLRIKYAVDHNKQAPVTVKNETKPEKVDSGKVLSDDPGLKNIVDRFNGEIIGKKKADN
jgi:DNA polymerase III subunit gamma/tau